MVLEKDGEDQLVRSCEKKTLQRGKDERNIQQTIQRKKTNWIGHILRWTCLLKHVIEGKRDVTGRRRIKRKQLLDDFK